MKQKEHKIAIIGSGFSGISVLAHIIEKATQPTTIYLIEKSSSIAKGVAYGTDCPWHPLNVRACDMGAFAAKPDDFYNWLVKQEKHWRELDPAFTSLPISPHAFYPRKLYAAYLADLFQKSLQKAAQRNIRCQLFEDEAIDVAYTPGKELLLQLKSGQSLNIDSLVLAIGAPPVKPFPFETPSLQKIPFYTSSLWTPSPQSLFGREAPITNNTTKLVMIGSGLTAIDALFTLRAKNFKGHIHVLSKHGHFPNEHPKEPLLSLPFNHVSHFPKENIARLKYLRKEVAEAMKIGFDWRQVFDTLRTVTTSLWHELSHKQKQQFLRHLFPIWNKHRHRMSPESAQILKLFCKENRLEITPGIIEELTLLPDEKIEIKYLSRQSGKMEKILADHVINCAGPDYAIGRRNDPLVQNLLAKSLLEADDLGLGFKVVKGIDLAGQAQGKIYTLGSLLFGEKFETTAVPEIRHQASMIAAHIMK